MSSRTPLDPDAMAPAHPPGPIVTACIYVLLMLSGCERHGAGKPVHAEAHAADSEAGGLLNPTVQDGALPHDIPATAGTIVGSLRAAAKKSSSQWISVDSAPYVQAWVLRTGRGARYSLANSAGDLVVCSNYSAKLAGGDIHIELFSLKGLPPGQLKVTLSAGDEPAQLDLSLRTSNGRRMVAIVTPLVSAPGQSISITSKIVDADGTVLSSGSEPFSASVQGDDGTTQAVAMKDDGRSGDGAANDGVFGGSYVPARPGRYGLVASGTRTVGAELVSRTGATEFVVGASGASFVGEIVETTVDADGNGLYDALKFEQSISFTENGHYMVVTELMAGPVELTTLRWSFINTAGATTQKAVLSVAGTVLSTCDRAGPWTLSNLRISREDVGSLIVATEPDHETRDYPLSSFERPPAPEIGGFTPMEGTWKGGTAIRLFGKSLAGTREVLFGGRTATFEIRGNYDLGLVTPPLPEPPTSSLEVEVQVITRSGRCTAPQRFVYTR